jgi:hypothetical protein
MIGKLLACVSLASFLLVGTSVRSQPVPMQSHTGKQSEHATKSVSGKVTSIGTAGQSFAMEVDGSSKQTMEFVVDKNTEVKGQVKEGTAVIVEYHITESGQNVAVSISARA